MKRNSNRTLQRQLTLHTSSFQTLWFLDPFPFLIITEDPKELLFVRVILIHIAILEINRQLATQHTNTPSTRHQSNVVITDYVASGKCLYTCKRMREKDKYFWSAFSLKGSCALRTAIWVSCAGWPRDTLTSFSSCLCDIWLEHIEIYYNIYFVSVFEVLMWQELHRTLLHIILTAIWELLLFPHFTDKETEAWRG